MITFKPFTSTVKSRHIKNKTKFLKCGIKTTFNGECEKDTNFNCYSERLP